MPTRIRAHSHPTRRTSLGMLAVAGLALAAAPALSQGIQTGKIEFDKRCYIVGEHPTVTVTGSSFAPDTSLQLVLKKRNAPAQTLPVTTDAAGGFTLSVPNPGEEVSTEVVDASGLQLADKTLKATKFQAGYTFGVPHRGPTRVKDTMVISGSGFAGGQQGTRGGPESLYLHRVGPGGKTRTELLSLLRPCGFGGTNRVTGRPLFQGGGPKARFDSGRWTFQFDTSSRYSKSTKQKIVLRLRVSRKGIVTPGEQTKIGTP
jgi:hypothetical protein